MMILWLLVPSKQLAMIKSSSRAEMLHPWTPFYGYDCLLHDGYVDPIWKGCGASSLRKLFQVEGGRALMQVSEIFQLTTLELDTLFKMFKFGTRVSSRYSINIYIHYE